MDVTVAVTETVTSAVSDYPAVTDVANGIEVFFYDVSEYNTNSAGFFDSVAKFANNIIDAVKSTEDYFVWIRIVTETVFDSDYLPAVFGSMASIALFFLLLDFIRNR